MLSKSEGLRATFRVLKLAGLFPNTKSGMLSDGLNRTFEEILSLSRNCKYKDCTHTNEAGCAVIEAVEKGELDRSILDNYYKMQKEKSHFETTIVEKRKKERLFGKILKDCQKRNMKGK